MRNNCSFRSLIVTHKNDVRNSGSQLYEEDNLRKPKQICWMSKNNNFCGNLISRMTKNVNFGGRVICWILTDF